MKSAQVSVFDQKRKQKASLNYTPPRPLSERAGEREREYYCHSLSLQVPKGTHCPGIRLPDMSYATENDRMMLDTA